MPLYEKRQENGISLESDTQDFVVHLGRAFQQQPRAGCVIPSSGLFRFVSNKGDRRRSDHSNVRRVRLDGWKSPYPAGAKGHIAFKFKLAKSCFATGDTPGAWINLFELHARKLPTDKEDPTGPLRLILERSDEGKFYYRVRLRSFDGAVTILKQVEAVQGREEHFTIDFRNDQSGWVFVSHNGQPFADHEGSFSYGTRALYACFGLYSSEREGEMRAVFDIEAL
ncbi:hypothetical protein [Sphingobium sp.]|uniref:hypothetical protein n=1 Tax=Sphingobium sp. TaxID=1912891 RepID=UPI0029C0266F|nr:hypothetical protein [Sphingobium sp.]